MAAAAAASTFGGSLDAGRRLSSFSSRRESYTQAGPSAYATAALEVTRLPFKEAVGAGVGTSGAPRGPIPLSRWIDPERLGAALLISSACEDIEEKSEAELETPDPFYTNPNLLVPGGKFRLESKASYREQSLLGVDLMAEALESIGVPTARIFHNDYISGEGSEPREAVQNLIRRISPHAPDILVYYAGLSIAEGSWALGWYVRDSSENMSLVTSFLDPEDLCPELDCDGPPGRRFVVADAPATARMWLRPATRLVGLAAWEGAGLPGLSGGPPLARWLSGQTRHQPSGVVAFDLPPDVEMRKLPAYRPLFWGPPPEPSLAGRLLWELQEFVGAPTKFEVQKQACHEFLARGGPPLLLLLLQLNAQGEEALLLQIVWLLHHLVVHAPVKRWAGTMEEALEGVLQLVRGRASTSALLAAVLGFAAATASRCPVCREQCAGTRWPEIHGLVVLALERERNVKAAVAASRLVTQVASVAALVGNEHSELVDALVNTLLADFGSSCSTAEVRTATAEAMLFTSLRSNDAKRQLLLRLGRSKKLPSILEGSPPPVVAKVLSLLRSIAAVEPCSDVGRSLDRDVVDAVIHCLCSHASDAHVQRWGLAVLGALAASDQDFAERGADAGATCVIWALGADELSGAAGVEQEALFCAHSLCVTVKGRAVFSNPETQIIGLVAGVLSRNAHCGNSSANAEACTWGLKFFERLSRGKETLPAVEPYIGVIVDALCAEGCQAGAAAAAAGTLSLLADRSPTAHDRILPHTTQIVKALTTVARRAAANSKKEEVGRKLEKDLRDWANVIVNIMGEPDDRTAERELEDAEQDEPEASSGYHTPRDSNDGTEGSKRGSRRASRRTSAAASGDGGGEKDGRRASEAKGGEKAEGAAQRRTSGTRRSSDGK